MPTYVVAGASRGIGRALLKRLADDPGNTVFGLVRNLDTARVTIATVLPTLPPNVHIVHADLDDYRTLQTAAAEVAAALGDAGVDVFIANAGIGLGGGTTLSEEINANPETFEKNMLATFRTNVLGTSEAVAAFAPLVVKAVDSTAPDASDAPATPKIPKIVVISSAMGDLRLNLDVGIDNQTPYAVSKAAVNMAVAKFHLEFRDRGVAVFGVSPGIVATEFGRDPDAPPPSPEQMAARMASFGRLMAKFRAYAPHWEPRMLTPDESAASVLNVIAGATIAKDGGLMVSHHGTQTWF